MKGVHEISVSQLQEFMDFALELRGIARKIIAEEVGQGFGVETKDDKSFVTSIDTLIEKLLSKKISECYPDHGIIGEEFGEKNAGADFVWTLDPIDGTEEFVFGVPLYGTIIALLFQGSPVVGLIDHPALDLCVVGASGLGVFCNEKKVETLQEVSESRRLYIGSRHQFLREQDDSEIFSVVSKHFPNLRVFCTCYSFTGIINGQADVAVEYNLKIWDLAAVEILIKEVGGDFVRIGEHKTENGLLLYGAVFGKKQLVSDVLSLLSEGTSTTFTRPSCRS